MVGISFVLAGLHLRVLLSHLSLAFHPPKFCPLSSSDVVSSPALLVLVNLNLSDSSMVISERLYEGAEIKRVQSAMSHWGHECFSANQLIRRRRASAFLVTM